MNYNDINWQVTRMKNIKEEIKIILERIKVLEFARKTCNRILEDLGGSYDPNIIWYDVNDVPENFDATLEEYKMLYWKVDYLSTQIYFYEDVIQDYKRDYLLELEV